MRRIADRFLADHQRLEALLRRLGEDADSPDRNKLIATWNEFESCLTWHMEAEERYLLPLIEAAHTSEARAIADEHAAIRKLVSELGVLVDLHAVPQATVTALIRELREHSAREEATLYAWTEEAASTALERCLHAMLSLAPGRHRVSTPHTQPDSPVERQKRA